uniref:Microtubule-associated protein futsch n=1 Tax=Anopheles farauti TaxID=69004 RepID=A0A182QI33_9DIPT
MFRSRFREFEMGNALCKEPRTGSTTPGTGNTFGNLSSVICPNGLGKGKAHPMRKTYFTRSAVDASKKTTSATGWQSVGFHVPDAADRTQQNVIDKPPVAPPRKKRGATLDGRYRSDEALKVRNGFQDVFGRESRRHSCDIPSVTRPASVPPPRPEVAALPARQTSCFEIDASNDAFSDFSKVPTTAELEKSPCTTQIPRVGNRKSDKFFGERLADSLSLEQEIATREQETKTRKEKSPPPQPCDDVDKIETFVEHKEAAVQERSTTQPEVTKKVEEEDLMKYIDRTVSADNQIGRRAEFLMAMLEDYNDSVRYGGMQPVEEPLIVPKRRKSKHICDDHDHMHNKLHAHERETATVTTTDPTTSPNVIRTEVSIEQAPRKPSRDFSRYKPIDADPVASGGSDSEQGGGSVVRPARTKQKPKQAPQSPPPDPPLRFPKSHSETQFATTTTTTTATPALEPPTEDDTPKAHTPRMLKRIISMPTTENLATEARTDGVQRPVLRKSSSSGSFAAVDLQRTRISVERFTPEDYVHRSSGVDELVKPKSKLTTRKISCKSNEAPVCRTPTPTPESQPNGPSFTIGGTAVVTSDTGSLLSPPEVPSRKRADTASESTPTARTAPQSHAAFLVDDVEDSSLRQFCLGSFIESSRVLPHHDVVNVLDRIYSATDNQENIVEQFQTFLEDAINSKLNDPHPVDPNVAKLLEKLSHTSSDDGKQLENEKLELVGSSHSSSEMDDCFDPEFEKIEKSEIVGDLPKIEHGLKHGSGRRRDSIEYMSDWFGGDSDGSTTMLSSIGGGVGASEERGSVGSIAKPHPNHTPYGSRKESIEDVGSWFSKHSNLRPSFGEEFQEPSRRLRRGSDGFLGYDLQRQYPFGKGRDRSDSLSAVMFEDITKLQEQRTEQQLEPIPQHPQRKRVLEHHNSSDALLMKVLTRTNLTPHSISNEKKQQEESPDKAEESNPLLSVEKQQSVVEAEKDANKATKEEEPALEPSTPQTTVPNDERDHNEHSTLLKFLSKEKLIE